MSTNWLRSLAVYGDRRIWPLGLLGFASGLPLSLSGGTLSAWLSDAHISKQSIGLFAWVGSIYAFKFLWSPLVDRIELPWLAIRLGQRRSWMVLAQVLLAVSLAAMALVDPAKTPWTTAALAVLVALWSATQDIAIDAFRVERAGPDHQGDAASMAVFGYRVGFLAGSAGTLYVAEFGGWSAAYFTVAGVMAGALAVTLACAEPMTRMERGLGGPSVGWLKWLQTAVVQPLVDFATRPGWLTILLFVALFKVGDKMAATMFNPFYLELGFSKVEIANVTKVFGLGATLVGAAAGGALVHAVGIGRGLWLGGMAQTLTLALYGLQAVLGHNLAALATVHSLEQAGSAIGTAAFTAYLSSLCNVRYTATQYALLTSAAELVRLPLPPVVGWVAEHCSWLVFFEVAALATLPGLLVLARLQFARPKPT